MAKKKKDPAFLFYPADFLIGTFTMNFQNRGKYITLLSIMHQQGRLSDKAILTLIGKFPDELKSKFLKDEKGLWYNERLEEEQTKRKRYNDSRKANLMGSHMGDDMEGHTVNVNVNVNKKFNPPSREDVIKYFEDNDYNPEIAKKAYLYYSEQNWHDSQGKPIKNWKGKMISVWFKEENKKIVKGKVNLAELSNDRKNNFT
jgi:hypothetical protein